MNCAVEVALHPLCADWADVIDGFLAGLGSHAGLEVDTGPMSTRIYGEWDLVMGALAAEMRAAYARSPHAAFTLKVLGDDPRGFVRERGYSV